MFNANKLCVLLHCVALNSINVNVYKFTRIHFYLNTTKVVIVWVKIFLSSILVAIKLISNPGGANCEYLDKNDKINGYVLTI